MIEERFAQVGPYRMFFRAAGRGPAVLLLHGIPTHSVLWQGLMPSLVSQYTVIAPDLIGYGNSGRGPESDLTLPRQAAHVLGLLDALGVAEAHVVGHDLGGGIGQILAIHSPTRVLSLAVADGVCFSNFPIPDVVAMRWPVAPEFQPSAPRIEAMLRRGLVNPERLAPDLLQALTMPVTGPGGSEDMRRAAAALEHHQTQELVPLLGTIRAPVTILWGDHDRFLPPYWGARLHQAIPNSTFRLLTRCGHFCMIDNPGLVAQELLGHLQQATARRVAAAHFSAAQPAPPLPAELDPALTPSPPGAPA